MVTDIIHTVAQPVVINIEPIIAIMVVAIAITDHLAIGAIAAVVVVIIITALAHLAVIPATAVVMATTMVVTTTNQKFSS